MCKSSPPPFPPPPPRAGREGGGGGPGPPRPTPPRPPRYCHVTGRPRPRPPQPRRLSNTRAGASVRGAPRDGHGHGRQGRTRAHLEHEAEQEDHGHAGHDVRVVLYHKLVAQHGRVLVALLADRHGGPAPLCRQRSPLPPRPGRGRGDRGGARRAPPRPARGPGPRFRLAPPPAAAARSDPWRPAAGSAAKQGHPSRGAEQTKEPSARAGQRWGSCARPLARLSPLPEGRAVLNHARLP